MFRDIAESCLGTSRDLGPRRPLVDLGWIGGEVAEEWTSSALTGGAGSPADPIELLSKLEELHEKGVLNDSQFEAQKQRLLGS